ncbi:alpha/beta hydrolase [Agriterribacter sp.]|uniref:alpha/beta hydrolase n=1 Tax=Agriterribacter sp. TaxID=2821509 RepID=UPI002BD263B4|nr:alpha/beta hydrolase [Agriterribacter sp.]HRP54415.1 alpha/beta hydrolase [Agriterribacter sp.]
MQFGQYFCAFVIFISALLTSYHDEKPVVAFTGNNAKHGAAVKHQSYTEIPDVQYGDADNHYQLLDAYLPDDRNHNTKVIVYIHGGSWVQGDKTEFPKPLIEELAGKRKYALASLNYRLVKNGKNTFPAQIEDVQKALAFISANAAEYRYDGNSFALIGASAGAHLAMLCAYGYDSLKQVKTVVDIFGPSDLSDETVRKPGTESNDIIVNFLGTPDTFAKIVKQSSPYFHLTQKTGVPTVLFHGTADDLVPVDQSEKLYKKLQQLGIPSKIKLYPGEKHELRAPIAADVFSTLMAWLDEHYPVKK